MLKRFSLTILCCILYAFGLAQSNSGGFNPDNPPDPDLFYTLRIEASPDAGGNLSPKGVFQKLSGQSISCSATANTGYSFRCWMIGDSVVSNVPNFTYTTTREDVVLTAYFDERSYFNPSSPDDPFPDGYYHRLTVYATPSAGGYFNNSSTSLVEGATTSIYAYPYTNFRFVSWKQNGIVVSTSNPLTVTMGQTDLSYTAQFVFDPINPANPGANSVNSTTGEIIVDDFTSGYLNSTISNLATTIGSNAVRSITVYGTMDASDFGFSRNYSNCEKVDISRTSGYTQVPDYAFRYSYKLREIHLPSSVTNIGYQAFNRCDSLKVLYCYSVNPPTVTRNSFTGMPAGTVIYVPQISQQLYQQALYWRNYTILPMSGQTSSLTVNLPQNAATGKYRDMILELRNTSSGQITNLVITNATSYTFTNIMRNTKCNVSVKNGTSLSLGEITAISIGNQDDTVSFTSLLEPKVVKVNVVSPAGINMNDSVDVTWYDSDGQYLGVGDSIANVLSGTRLKYKIGISDQLALTYTVPQDSMIIVNDSNNVYRRTLSPISKIVIRGYVKENITSDAIKDVSVTIVQKVNSKQSKTHIVTTDANGLYTDTILNVPATFAFSNSEYINQSISVNEFIVESGVVQMADVMMASATGVKAYVGFTFQSSKRPSEDTTIVNYISNVQDVDYTLFSVTKNKSLDQVYVQYPKLTILSEVSLGDSVLFTATSRRKAFAPVTVGARLDTTGSFNITFPVLEYGKISASFGYSSNNNEVGILYNANGERISQHSYSDLDTLTISDLQDGHYTLISMDRNSAYNNFVNLSRFSDVGLVLNQDYRKDTVTVRSGLISVIYNDTIPLFSDLHLNLIDRSNSSFLSDKSSVVAGNYITLSATVEIPDSNLRQVSNLKLIVDIPQSAAFIANSVMIGNSTVSNYTINGNSITIPFSAVGRNNKIKFCVLPTVSGTFEASAIIQATESTGTFMTSMSTAHFEVEDITLRIPTQTPKTEITVCGVSAPGATVEIYDNNTLIGTCTSNQNGSWNAICPLNNAYNLSSHNIYAKVIVGELTALSQTQTCIYNKDASVEVSKVTMHHWNPEMHKNYELVFDYQNPNKSPGNYVYYIYNKKFTFNVDFTINDTSLVDFVTLWVLSGTGKWSALYPEYDTIQGNWYVEGDYGNMYDGDIPVNVSVDYFPKIEFHLDTNYALSVANEFNAVQDSIEEKRLREDSLYSELNMLLSDSLNLDTIRIKNIKSILYTDITSSEIYDQYIDSVLSVLENTSSQGLFDNILSNALDLDGVDSLLMLLDVNQKTLQFPSSNGTRLPVIEFLTNDTSSSLLDLDLDGIWELDSLSSENIVVFINKQTNQSIKVYLNGNQSQQLPPNHILPRNTSSGNSMNASDYVSIYNGVVGLTSGTWESCIDHYNGDVSEKLYNLKKWDIQSNRLLDKGRVDAYQKIQSAITPKIHELEYLNHELKALKKCGAIGLVGSGVDLYQHYSGGGETSNKWESLISDARNLCPPYNTSLANEASNHKNWYDSRVKRCGIGKVATASLSAISLVASVGSFGMSLAVGVGSFAADIALDHWKRQYEYDNENNYQSMMEKIRNAREKCNQPDTTKRKHKDPPTPPAKYSLDPSGFVYEGVSTNRLPGVTTTCYYKDSVENIYGDLTEQAIVWDASEYDQENPLHTDSNGFYQWFVPTGLWQVKYEKTGYETTYSEWLPVPPPQLEVNIGMVQNRQPVVSSAHAYTDGIVAEFDKYMKPDLLDTSNIYVKVGNAFVSGTISLLDEEVAYRDSTVRYVSKFRFTPDAAFTASQVTLIISNKVKSYADVAMQEAYIQTFAIENEVSGIVMDSVITVGKGQTTTVRVTTLPVGAAVGRQLLVNMPANNVAACDSSSYTLDTNGEARINITGLRNGAIGMNVSVASTYASASATINVVNAANVPVTISQSDAFCQGSTYYWRGRTITAQGVYTDTAKHTNVSDTIYRLTLSVKPSYFYAETNTILQGTSLTWHGKTLTQAGVYYDSLLSAAGCDSVYQMTLVVGQKYLIPETYSVCQGESYMWHGKNRSNAGVYYDSLLTVLGYDSVYQLTLTVNPVVTTNLTLAACTNGQLPDWVTGAVAGNTYHHYDTLSATTGCDSIVHTTLMVNPTYFNQQSVIWPSASGNYSWHGKTITGSGVYYDSLTTVNTGCDSVFQLNITFADNYLFEESHSICQGDYYDWHGHRYTTAGVYYDSLKTAAQVDSIYKLTLTVNQTYFIPESYSICQGETYNWHNRNLTTSGTYYDSLHTTAGCDSVYMLTFTVNPNYFIQERHSICQGDIYQWHNRNLNVAGTYYDSLTSSAGCDSVYELTLTVNQTYYIQEQYTICQGDYYQWHNRNLNSAGVYYDSLTSAAGCDSIYELTLTVNPSYFIQEQYSICQGDYYQWHYRNLNTAGVYYDSLFTSAGCDSIYELTLTFNSTYFIQRYDTICQGDVYYWNGQYIAVSGVYYDSLKTVNGCDSVIELTLAVNPTYLVADTAQLPSDGSGYVWHGETYTEAGDYVDTLTSSLGCDSVCTLHLTEAEVTAVEDVRTIEITLAPNPIRTGEIAYIYAEWTAEEQDGMIVEVLTTTGTTVARMKPETFPIAIEGVNAAGTYIVRITTGTGEAYIRKLIVH